MYTKVSCCRRIFSVHTLQLSGSGVKVGENVGLTLGLKLGENVGDAVGDIDGV